jgi:squalene cyclase
MGCLQIADMIARGVQFIRDQQREDGSWYGSWAVCFTYGCWFAAEAISAGGDPTGVDSGALVRCCAFLLSQQLPDGGWGETYLSCLTKIYTNPEPQLSQIINTAWAVLALIAAQCADSQAVKRGVDFIIRKQLSDGNWEQERISGAHIVNNSALYCNTHFTFTCCFCVFRYIQSNLWDHVFCVSQYLPFVGPRGV